MKNIIFDFNRTLYNPDTKALFPETIPLLQSLIEKGYRLHLVSRFVKEGRYEVITETNIHHYFKNILLVQQKNTEVFSLLSKDYESVVIGDVLWEEIEIGNTLGLTTVWFCNGKFSTDTPQNDNQKPDHTIYELSELKNIL